MSTCTTCPYCGVGCGVVASPQPDHSIKITGDTAHPANLGRLCSKGTALGETLGLDERIVRPQIDGQDAPWDQALGLVATRFGEAITRYGPDSVAFYVSGQLLTEDYYVANKLMKGFIGSANIDTNSRLCMASTVAGQKRAFGADTVPGTYEDLEQADMIVLVGSNLAWCHPVLFQRIAAAKEARPNLRIVNIDPRRTATSELADTHLAIAPGSDVALFNGLLTEVAASGRVNEVYTRRHVGGLAEAIAAAGSDDPSATGLDSATLDDFYAAWIGTEKVVTVFSQGVNQSSSGTDKVNAIINCHLATGRIGKAGMGPFSVTGQPNAMGGREVGGLANMLACHLDIGDPVHRHAVREFWKAPALCDMPGLKAVDLFDACAEGKIKALWIMSTNPAVSLPRADAVRDAIAQCEFVVVSDITQTDTTALADIVLPATAWGEKSGTVTNSERRISRQRAFLPAPGNARPDWRIMSDVAALMGWADEFDYDSPAEIFREYAGLSGVAASLGSDFDISGLAALSDAGYEAMQPVQWPVPKDKDGQARFFADGNFYTPDRKARMIAVTQRGFAVEPSDQYPLRLNTGRIRDQWHTMTRTALAPRLSAHLAEPFAEIHPDDARAAAVKAADLLKVTSPDGAVIVRALVTERIPRGSIFVPMHWTSNYAAKGRICAAIAAAVDPVSGQPELKGSVARVERFDAEWFGFAVQRDAATPPCEYWARARIHGGWRTEMAGVEMPKDWQAFATSLFGAGNCTVVADSGNGAARIAVSDCDGVKGVLFASSQPVAAARGFIADAFSEDASAATLLAGFPAAEHKDSGAIVCSCFGVGVNTINDAIQTRGLMTVDQIGACVDAGTNCGSCRPELHALLASAQATHKVAAE